MDPYIQSLQKGKNWQFKYKAFNSIFSSDISYCHIRFYTKKTDEFLEKAEGNAIWILIK